MDNAIWEEIDLAVTDLLRVVSDTLILPSFQRINAADIFEKSPGELVTVVDRAAEREISDRLSDINFDARIVGEEATALSPSLLKGLDQGAVWIVDPIDGTGNFVKGEAPFGIIIGLAIDGVMEAGWLFDPLERRMCKAKKGGGAFVNDVAIQSQATGQDRPVISLASQFLSPEQRERLTAVSEGWADVVPIPRCAAEHYPRLCLHENDIALFQRTLPWDHAAGALFLEEAGGKVSRWDGDNYEFHDDRSGIIAAATPELWELALENLINRDTGLQPECDISLLAASI